MGLGDHPETFLQKALCCQTAPSWLKVRGGGWWEVAHEILLSALGLGVVSILYSIPRSQVPSPSPSRLTILLCQYNQLFDDLKYK